MSCNGCRVLRRGCNEKCALRPCVEWIDTPQAQAHATLFVSKFFGRSDLMSFVSAVPDLKKPALFRSLLYEACGRTVNPVNGAVGLLSTGNWHLCEAAVEIVLAGGIPRPAFGVGVSGADSDEAFGIESRRVRNRNHLVKSKPLFVYGSDDRMVIEFPASNLSDLSVASCGSGDHGGVKRVGGKEPKLLNLFV